MHPRLLPGEYRPTVRKSRRLGLGHARHEYRSTVRNSPHASERARPTTRTFNSPRRIPAGRPKISPPVPQPTRISAACPKITSREQTSSTDHTLAAPPGEYRPAVRTSCCPGQTRREYRPTVRKSRRPGHTRNEYRPGVRKSPQGASELDRARTPATPRANTGRVSENLAASATTSANIGRLSENRGRERAIVPGTASVRSTARHSSRRR